MNHLELNWRCLILSSRDWKERFEDSSDPKYSLGRSVPPSSGVRSQANREVRVQIGGAARNTAGVPDSFDCGITPNGLECPTRPVCGPLS